MAGHHYHADDSCVSSGNQAGLKIYSRQLDVLTINSIKQFVQEGLPKTLPRPGRMQKAARSIWCSSQIEGNIKTWYFEWLHSMKPKADNLNGPRAEPDQAAETALKSPPNPPFPQCVLLAWSANCWLFHQFWPQLHLYLSKYMCLGFQVLLPSDGTAHPGVNTALPGDALTFSTFQSETKSPW